MTTIERKEHSRWKYAEEYAGGCRHDSHVAVVTKRVREDTDLNVYETFVSEVPLTVVPTEVLRTLVNESKKNGGWAGPIQDAESFLPTESPVIYFMVTSHFTQQARRVEPKEKGGYLPISLQEQMDADLIVAHLEDGSTLTIKDRNRTS